MKKVGSILESHFRGTPYQPLIDLGRLAAAWPQLQGEPWGSACWPLRLQNGVLTVGLADSSWAQRLAFESLEIALRAEGFLGYAVALRHRVVQAGAGEESFEPVAPSHDDPDVTRALAGIPPGPLHDAFQAYLERLAAFQHKKKE